jgi:hypothetical protein
MGGKDVDCDVAGVDEGGGFVEARAVKIADSGAGFAYLIYGGDGGIRLRPAEHDLSTGHPWSLDDPLQWGESHMVLSDAEDVILDD